MAKALLPFLASLLLLSLGSSARCGDDPHSLEKIAKSLAELTNRPPVLHYRFEKTDFRPKGSMNWELQFDEHERNRRQKLAEEKLGKNLPYKWEDFDQGVSLPSEDITITTTQESIRDLAKGMSWSKGEDAAFEIVRDANDLPRVKFWREPFEKASDGVDHFSRFDSARHRFKDRGNEFRVSTGFSIWRYSAERNERSPSFEWLPRGFCEGNLPAPKQPYAWSRNDWPFLAERWTRGAEEQDSEGHPIIYSLPWFAGLHYQCNLRPDLHYVPCKWQSYYQDQLKDELEIEYEQVNDGMPVLRSWKYRSFYEGKLQVITTFRVVSVERESSVDPALFRLKPPDGVLVVEIKTENDGFYVAGRQTIKSQSIPAINAKLLVYEVRFQWFNGILAGCSLLVGTVVVLTWRRFPRQSAPSSRGQELPA